MLNYYKNDIEICLDFSVKSKFLEESFGKEGSEFSPYYDARIAHNYRKPNCISLIIYYPQSEYLFEKLQKLQEEGVSILQCIKTRQAQQAWIFPDILDFSKSNLLKIEESHHWEHNKKPLIIEIDNLDIIINSRYVGDGNFQLTENVNQHIYEYINYGELGNYSSLDRFITSDNNREVTFGEIQLILSFKHEYGDSTKFNFEINRDAFLTITDNSESLTDLEILEHGNVLCTLMSFYWQKTIDYFKATIRINNQDNYRTREVYKNSGHPIDESLEYTLKSSYSTIYDFFESLNHAKVFTHKVLLDEIVSKIIRTKSVDNISEFMLLYNIVEKIRNYCISNPIDGSNLEIREEFKFTKTKNATEKFIKNKIKDIVEIVDSDDKADFLSKANNKVNFIKKTGLIDQFDSLIDYLQLDTAAYNIEFDKLIKIRNDIYHGKEPQYDVRPYNEKLIELIYDLILKLIQ